MREECARNSRGIREEFKAVDINATTAPEESTRNPEECARNARGTARNGRGTARNARGTARNAHEERARNREARSNKENARIHPQAFPTATANAWHRQCHCTCTHLSAAAFIQQR
eukprot:12845430-Alexandrium_andersonii.AAC.1